MSVSNADAPIEAVSVDLFGTLVDAERPPDPAAAVAAELRDRGVAIPDDWATAYAHPHDDRPPGAERPLHEHVAAALASRFPTVEAADVVADAEAAVRAAFDRPVATRDGAADGIRALADGRPVAVLSNCSVPGLAERALARSTVDPALFESVVTSVECGWRKPDRRAFETVAGDLGVPVDRLLHIGDDPETDGGAASAGAAVLLVEDQSLASLATTVEARWG